MVCPPNIHVASESSNSAPLTFAMQMLQPLSAASTLGHPQLLKNCEDILGYTRLKKPKGEFLATQGFPRQMENWLLWFL